MSTRPVSLPRIGPAPFIAAAGLGAAVIVGVLTAHRVPLGIGVLIGLLYAPLVFFNFRVGLALFIALTFIRFLPALSVGPNAAGILVLVAWIGTIADRREGVREYVARFPWMIGAVVSRGQKRAKPPSQSYALLCSAPRTMSPAAHRQP